MRRSLGSIYFGFLIVLLGVGLLAQNAGLVQVGDILSTWWPTYIFIAIGAFAILNHRHKGGLIFGGILVILGVVWQLEQVNLITGNATDIIFALILVLFGLMIVYRALFPPAKFKGFSTDTDTIMGEMDHDYSHKDYAHSDTSTVLGQTKIDLRTAKFTSEKVTLNTNTVLGETKVFIPTTVRVEKKLDIVLGDIEDHSRSAADAQTTLVITGTVFLGTIKILN